MKLYSMVFAALFAMFTIFCYGLKKDSVDTPEGAVEEVESPLETLKDVVEDVVEEAAEIIEDVSEVVEAVEETVKESSEIAEETLDKIEEIGEELEEIISDAFNMEEEIEIKEEVDEVYYSDNDFPMGPPTTFPDSGILGMPQLVGGEGFVPSHLPPCPPQEPNPTIWDEPYPMPVQPNKMPIYKDGRTIVVPAGYDNGAPGRGPIDRGGPYKVPGPRINTGVWVKEILKDWLEQPENASFDDDQMWWGMYYREFMRDVQDISFNDMYEELSMAVQSGRNFCIDQYGSIRFIATDEQIDAAKTLLRQAWDDWRTYSNVAYTTGHQWNLRPDPNNPDMYIHEYFPVSHETHNVPIYYASPMGWYGYCFDQSLDNVSDYVPDNNSSWSYRIIPSPYYGKSYRNVSEVITPDNYTQESLRFQIPVPYYAKGKVSPVGRSSGMDYYSPMPDIMGGGWIVTRPDGTYIRVFPQSYDQPYPKAPYSNCVSEHDVWCALNGFSYKDGSWVKETSIDDAYLQELMHRSDYTYKDNIIGFICTIPVMDDDILERARQIHRDYGGVMWHLYEHVATFEQERLLYALRLARDRGWLLEDVLTSEQEFLGGVLEEVNKHWAAIHNMSV